MTKFLIIYKIFAIFVLPPVNKNAKGRRGLNRMVVGFKTIITISSYHP